MEEDPVNASVMKGKEDLLILNTPGVRSTFGENRDDIFKGFGVKRT